MNRHSIEIARRAAEIEAAKAIKRPLDSKLFNMDKWETPK